MELEEAAAEEAEEVGPLWIPAEKHSGDAIETLSRRREREAWPESDQPRSAARAMGDSKGGDPQ